MDTNTQPAIPGSGVTAAERKRIDDLMQPVATTAAAHLDREIGTRFSQVTPLVHCLVVARDHGATGLDTAAPRLHGSLPAQLQAVYANLIGERDALATRAHQEWRPLVAPVTEHVAALRAPGRNPDLLVGWLQHCTRADSAGGSGSPGSTGSTGADTLAVVPARAWLSRTCVFAFAAARPSEHDILALFYAAQRLAVALELRAKPYIGALLEMRFTAREIDVLKAGLRGVGDEEIAASLGLTVDAIRYYFKKFKHRVPVEIGHLKPRDLSRILHHLGKL
jgi:hypothetical protein